MKPVRAPSPAAAPSTTPAVSTPGARAVCDAPQVAPPGLDAASIRNDVARYLSQHLGRSVPCAPHYLNLALSWAIRDRLMADWQATQAALNAPGQRRACYLSLEYLIGRTLGNHLLNRGLEQPAREALMAFATDFETLEQQEHDAGLGNGGLGRLAACFIDSAATLGLPLVGYGLRYEYGMFIQTIRDGGQFEEPDHWLRDGYPWEIERPEATRLVRFGGRTVHERDDRGHLRVRWIDTENVCAVPYDLPVPGYRNGIVNTLRLWKAEATDAFSLHDFNAGAYAEAVAEKNTAENITMVLYPNDATENGKELRLRQQYLLASASLQDTLADWLTRRGDQPWSAFADQHLFQLNDTHPAIAVAELMRLLIDEHGLGWDEAWSLTTATMAYTNHTLLPEALERWPVRLFERLLPRLLEIIYEINARFLEDVRRRWPHDPERIARMSLIEEDPERQVRMAYLAVVGSHAVNGVAELHSRLLREGLFADFHALWPEKFHNKTNGVTPRRWIAEANPDLAGLLDDTIGTGWRTDLDQLAQLRPLAEAPPSGFYDAWRAMRARNKQRLCELVERDTGVRFDPAALIDTQVKRIHEYKRQLLNLLHVVHLYARILRGEVLDTPRMVLIGGKAAPGYHRAKEIIALAVHVADVIGRDRRAQDQLRMVFLPNYNVSKMLRICAGTDLSEQISTAGKEASGTGNMKFMMNGALTIGTFDGANIEILDAVGAEHFFLFGLKAEEVEALKPHYDPAAVIDGCPELAEALQLIESDLFSGREPGRFRPLVDAVRDPRDPWMVAADFPDYLRAQREAALAWTDAERWTRSSILNTASSGRFSSDRTIREYNDDLWHLTPLRPAR